MWRALLALLCALAVAVVRSQELGMDQAAVEVDVLGNPIGIFITSDDCYHCLPHDLGQGRNFTGITVTNIGTAFGQYLEFRDWVGQTSASLKYHFTEHGQYVILVNATGSSVSVQLITVSTPSTSTYEPLLWAAVALVAMAVALQLVYALHACHKKRQQRFVVIDNEIIPDPDGLLSSGDESAGFLKVSDGAQRSRSPSASHRVSLLDVRRNSRMNPLPPGGYEPPAEKQRKQRLHSLDTFRGLSLSIMIFVNYGGGGYYFFNHSTWNGLTVADLVFPWFIFMMGVSMALSFESQRQQKTSKLTMLYRIVRRSLILFGLGLIVSNQNTSLEHLRIMGVLQRFGVSFLVVGLILAFVPKLDSNEGPLSDLIDSVFEWVVVLALLLVYTCITLLLDVPGCGRGYLGPGGIYGDFGQYPDCTGGAAGYIDKKILGIDHVYQSPTCRDAYGTGPYDPEGLLGCLTSVVLTYLGVQTGRVIVYFKTHGARVLRWLVWAVVLGSVAILLCKAEQNGGWIPLNKNMWSLSFIFAQAGSGMFMLALFYVIIDVLNWWGGGPFIFMGMNSIAMYCMSEVLGQYIPFSWQPTSPATHSFLLKTNLIAVALFNLIAYYMHTLDFYVKI